MIAPRILLLVGILAWMHPVRADDPDPAALLAEALAAHGGASGLAAWNNLRVDSDLTVFFRTTELPGTGTVWVRDGTMLRREAMLSFRGAPFQLVEACTGKSAWRRMRSRLYDYPIDDYVTWLTHRPTLLLQAATVEAAQLHYVGSGDIDGDPTRILEVTVAGDDPVRITLDETSMLVRQLEYKAMMNSGDGKPEEAFVKRTFGDYREVDGIPFPHLMEEFSDGVASSIERVTAVELDTEVALELFAKPVADDASMEWRDQIAN